jgi:hypothetical protein
MTREHIIPDEVLEIIQSAINRNENWMTYNNSIYFLEKMDVFFFKDKDAAVEFKEHNNSDADHFNVIHIESIADLFRQIPYGEFLDKTIDSITSKNLSIMNEQNLSYLKDNIKYQGFGESLNNELENQLRKGAVEFALHYKGEVNKREIEATLHFKRSDSSDMYFFNKYDTRTTTEKNNETIAQTFYLNKGHGVTLKEAYNLLNGRAVHKELIDKLDQKYHVWIQLDFTVKDKNGNFERKPYHQNYGYDLKEALSYYPIKEMIKTDDTEKLIRSLEKGNLQMVTLETPGKEIKVFIEANPKYKTVNLYNSKMQRLDKDQSQELMRKPEIKEQRKDQTQDISSEKKPDKKQTKVNSKSEDDTGLIQKKRMSNKKGMGI